LFEKAVEALGGEEALAKVKSIYAEVLVQLPEAGTIRREISFRGAQPFVVEDGAEFVMVEKRAGGEIVSGCDGETAWRVTGDGKAYIVKGRSTIELDTNANFHNVTRLFERQYPERRVEGVEQFDGRECYKVLLEAFRRLPARHVFFDRATGLLVGSRAGVIATYYREWKSVKGLQFATEVTTQSGNEPPVVAKLVEIKLDKVRSGAFKLPREVKKLIAAERKQK